MNLPITVTVDVAKATAKLSGPLVLGNTYQVTFHGLTEAQAARHPTLVILGRPQLTNQLDEGGRGVAVPTVAAMSTAAGVLALNTQEMADVFSMAGLPPQAVAERACDARKPQAVLPGEVLHGAVRPHAALALHFYVTTQGTVEAGVDTSADSNGATLAQGDCTVHWAPFQFDGAGNPMILRGPAGPVGPMGPAGIVAWPGCLTFQIDSDPASPLYGHLVAWAESRYQLYHDGNDGREGRPLEKHFVVCETDDQPMTGMVQGHIYQIYYPEIEDGEGVETRQFCDLGNVGVSSLLAQTLKNAMEQDSQNDGNEARTLNEARGKVNSLWSILKNACASLLGLSSAFAIAVGAWLLAGCAPALADEGEGEVWRPRAATRSHNPGGNWSILQDEHLVAGWTFTNVNGNAIMTPNCGNDAPDGHLEIDNGASLSNNVPPCNHGQGYSLSLGTHGDASVGNDEAAISPPSYDPLAGAEKFTICAWVFREWTPTDASRSRTNTAARIFSDTDGVSAGSRGVELRFRGMGGLYLLVNGVAQEDKDNLVPPFSRTWTHIAAAYDGTDGAGYCTFYVNGVQAQTKRMLAAGAVRSNETAVYIGNSARTHTDLSRFIGEIDDVFIFRDWVPEAPGVGNTCPDLEPIMGTHDGDFTTDTSNIAKQGIYVLEDAVPLGDIDPDTLMVTAEQLESAFAGMVPSEWLDHPHLPGLTVEGELDAGTLRLGEDRITAWSDLRGRLQGGYWLTPDRFSLSATPRLATVTNFQPSAQHGSVWAADATVTRDDGYSITADIVRSESWAELVLACSANATLTDAGAGWTLSWADGSAAGDAATVTGTMGNWTDRLVLTNRGGSLVTTQKWWCGNVAGSLRERLAQNREVWTNRTGKSVHRFLRWWTGTNWVPDSDFWAADLDFSGVSVWNGNGGYWYTKPATLLSSNIAVSARHWHVPAGTAIRWYGTDGQLHESTVADLRECQHDVCVLRLDPPLPATVTAYPVACEDTACRKLYAPPDMEGADAMALVSCAQSSSAWVTTARKFGAAGIGYGLALDGIWEDGEWAPNSRNDPVGGDSGHPTFADDGDHLTLVSLWETTGGGPWYGDNAIWEMLISAVASLGADTNAIVRETWADWPDYHGLEWIEN